MLSASQSVDPDYPLANLVDEARDACARIQSSANQYIQFDINAGDPPCNFFFIDRGHNLNGATVRLVGSDESDFDPSEQLFSVIINGDSAIFKLFDQETCEYFSLHLENLSANPSIFEIYFGESASMSKYPIGPCWPNILRAEKDTGVKI